VTAERAEIRTAAFFWTGTEAEIGGIRPSFWHLFDATVPALRDSLAASFRRSIPQMTLHELLIRLLRLKNPLPATMPKFGLRR
jgi:hypothetical protein